nr:hypothetical protein [Candidatus Electrothrix aestuarii]
MSDALPDELDWISGKVLVAADDRQSFTNGLGNNQSIKWISVMQRKIQQPGKMIWMYLKQLDLVRFELLRDKGSKGLGKFQFAYVDFDRDLPEGGQTQ